MIPIESSIEDRIATVTIRRPEKRNAMTLAMWREVTRLFKTFGADPAIRAIILTGETDFSVGADISEFAQVRATSEQSQLYEEAVDACTDAIAAAAKPTIAAINGYCIGGGCHLSMACDFRFLSHDAEVGIPAARLSIVYGIRSTQRLLALVGLTQAKKLLYSAQRIGAPEALSIGFADRLCDDPLAEATAFCRKIAENAPLSLAGSKFILDGLAMGIGGLDVAAARRLIDSASDSDDFNEGRKAFGEGRAPKFKGC